MNYKDIQIKMFPAKTGDCFFIEFIKADFRVLIDGGFVDTYKHYLKPYLLEIGKSGRHINLLIISHIDQDHYARNVSLQQYAFSIEQVPYYSEPKELQPVIEDAGALAALLHMPSNTRKGLRDKVIMSVVYDSGMRVDELVSMDVRNVCLDHNDVKLRLHGKGSKVLCRNGFQDNSSDQTIYGRVPPGKKQGCSVYLFVFPSEKFV